MLAVAIFCFAGIASAQSNGIPGTWKRVTADAFSFMSFIDSLHGIGVNDSFIITNDGGKSWNTLTTNTQPPGGGGHILVCTGISKAVFEKPNCDQFEIDGDSVIQADCPEDSPDSFYQTYTPFDQKMYDTSYGFRFVQEVQRGSILNAAYIAVTHDCWRTYSAHGDSLIGTELSTHEGGGDETEIDGATIVDSNEVWVGINNTIYRTTNAGASWDTLHPFANTTVSPTSAPNQFNIIVNKATQEVYVNLATKPVDYLYSSDYGKTWQIDSAFKGSMTSMSVVAPGVIWGELTTVLHLCA